MPLSFVVEQAGCSSCARLIRDTLATIGEVEDVSIDEANDLGFVRMTPTFETTEAQLNAVLLAASDGTGHAYSVRPGSLTQA